MIWYEYERVGVRLYVMVHMLGSDPTNGFFAAAAEKTSVTD